MVRAMGHGFLRFRRCALSRSPRSLLLLVSLLLPSRSLPAQQPTRWVFPTTVGYAGAGAAVGYFMGELLAKEAEEGGLDALRTPGAAFSTLAGAWLGGRLGFSIGSEADSLLADGWELKTGHRRGVQLGTVLAGASVAGGVGLMHAGVLEDGKTRLVTTYAVGGAVLGALTQVLLNRYLYPSTVSVTPHVSVGPWGWPALGMTVRLGSPYPR